MSFNYNNVSLVGRVESEPEIEDVSDTFKTSLTLAIQRPFKNKLGEYEMDYIPVVFWGRLATAAHKHLNQSDAVLLDGRIEMLGKSLVIVADNFQKVG